MIPAGMTIQDWGITYDELEPYYDKFEKMAGIAGKAGNIKGRIIQGGNVFEGPRSTRVPGASRSHDSHAGALLRKAAAELGYHPFPRPSANLPVTYKNPDGVTRGPCTYCGFCERFGCEVGAKADPTVTVIPLALKTGKFEIRSTPTRSRSRTTARRRQSVLYYDAHGRGPGAAGRHHHRRGVRVQQRPAAADVEARQAVRPRQRHRRRSAATTPTRRAAAARPATSRSKKFRRYMGSGALGTAIDDFNADNFDHSGPRASSAAASITSGQTRRAADPEPQRCRPGTPAFGRDWKVAVKQYYDRVMSVGFQGESPAYQTHYLDLDPTYRDTYGNPLLRITFDWEANERKMVAYAGTKLLEIMKAIGPDIIVGRAGLAAGPLRRGAATSRRTTRAARSWAPTRRTSVVNNYLQMWDAPNVFVVGACNFPQNAGFNPTGTVGALAYRAAEGILKYHKTGRQPRMTRASARRRDSHGGRRSPSCCPRTTSSTTRASGWRCATARSSRTIPTPRSCRRNPEVRQTDDVFPVGEPPSGFYLINV